MSTTEVSEVSASPARVQLGATPPSSLQKEFSIWRLKISADEDGDPATQLVVEDIEREDGNTTDGNESAGEAAVFELEDDFCLVAGHDVASLLGDSAEHIDEDRTQVLIDKVLDRIKPLVPVKEVEEKKDLEKLLKEELEKEEGNAFYLVDLATVVRKYDQWRTLLPRITPHYAVKCNPNPILIATLQTIGVKFDCASKGEIKLVMSQGAKPEDIIYANPCKDRGQIKWAKDEGVTMMTFDNLAELKKIKAICPEAKLVLRIKPPLSKAVMDFSAKFGANKKTARMLIKACKEMGLNLCGISFHVGSGCYETEAYVKAIKEARALFDAGSVAGFDMNLLDIGGGYPGSDDPETAIEGHAIFFKDIADVIRPLVDELFPPSVKVISEPGRYFVTESTVLCVNVIGRRKNIIGQIQDDSDDEGDSDDDGRDDDDKEADSFLYYLSDGVYGSFNAILFDHMHPKPNKLPTGEEGESAVKDPTKTFKSTMFGPTCDSMDVIVRDIDFPELNVGDWCYFYNMGAYTSAAGTNFNGIDLPAVTYIVSYAEDAEEAKEGGGELPE